MGLPLVLTISPSISWSYHILIAPDAPAPIDIQRIDRNIKKGCIWVGARKSPHIDVKIARDITLGFNKDKKSSTELSFVSFSKALFLAVFVTNFKSF